MVCQYWQAATFQDLGSSPSTMAASKCLDYYSCLPGHDGQQADAEQACIQSAYSGTPTWLVLPDEIRPKEWAGKYRTPVVRLDKALYGHPDSGTMWERHCGSSLKQVGFALLPSWPSTYWHRELRLLLTVYVDDFKLSGPKQHLAKGWELLTKT